MNVKPPKGCKSSACRERLSARPFGSETVGLGRIGNHGRSHKNGQSQHILEASAASWPSRDGEEQGQTPRLLDHSPGGVFCAGSGAHVLSLSVTTTARSHALEPTQFTGFAQGHPERSKAVQDPLLSHSSGW